MVPRAFERGAPLRLAPALLQGEWGLVAVSIGTPLCHEPSMTATRDEKCQPGEGAGNPGLDELVGREFLPGVAALRSALQTSTSADAAVVEWPRRDASATVGCLNHIRRR